MLIFSGSLLGITAFDKFHREVNFSQVIRIGIASAIGGLIGWLVYHRISGRYDGLVMFGMGALPLHDEPDQPLLVMIIISVWFSAFPAAIAGCYLRWTMRRAKRRKLSKSEDLLE